MPLLATTGHKKIAGIASGSRGCPVLQRVRKGIINIEARLLCSKRKIMYQNEAESTTAAPWPPGFPIALLWPAP